MKALIFYVVLSLLVLHIIIGMAGVSAYHVINHNEQVMELIHTVDHYIEYLTKENNHE